MRFKCTVKYDGTLFHGFQAQKELRTIQEEIEKVLLKINKKKTTIYASGRTDSGVHAEAQVFHFDTDILMSEANIKNALNSRLPRDIYISEVEKANDDFHARFSCVAKEYHYYIETGEYDPLLRNYRFFYKYKNLDVSKMREVAKIFVGRHDFESFTKNHKLTDFEREIFSLEIEEKNTLLIIKFKANGFLHNMVRILAAMLVEAGRYKYSLEDIKYILGQKNRELAPRILPSSGLYLFKVYY